MADSRLLGVYTSLYENKNGHVVGFYCDGFTFTGERDAEIDRFGFFRLDDLPDDLSPGTRRRPQECKGGVSPPGDAW